MSKGIGFIGGGAMATGIIKGILSANTLTAEEIYVKELLPERQVYLKETYGLQLADSLKELAEKAKVLVLAVRPQDAEKAAKELSEVITQDHVLVSICAGIKIEKLSGWIGEKVTYARIMPNTMTEIKRGYSALTFSENASEEAKQSVQRITDSIGSTLVIPEKQFDAFTALSCAGPEWLLLFSAALVDAGVECGIARADAKKIVTQNLIGTGLMLESTDKHPFQITDEMNTPGGIGIAGYHTFVSAGLNGIVMDAVQAAFKRTTELGK